MMRRLMAVILSAVCLFTSRPAFAGSALDQTSAEKMAGLKQQVVMIPAGTVIEVKLREKGSKKITGKLGPVSDEGFEVQSAKSGTVSSEKFAFADVKTIKVKRRMGLMTKVLIVAGVFMLVSGVVTGIIFLANS